MIRLFLTALFLVLFFIVSIPIFFVEWLIGKKNPGLKDRSSLAIVSWAFRVVMFIGGVKATYLGEDRIPKDSAVLYVGNHRSFFDVVVTYCNMKSITGYIAKVEIEKVPFLRVWMRYLHCLFLDRNNAKEGLKTILKAIESLKNGISIFIFPEGTRNKVADTFLPFHDGSFKIAQKAKCPIVPVTINNSSAVFEDHFPWIRKAHVVVEYGEPIYMEQLSSEDQKQIASYTQKIISDTYFKNKELV